MTPPPLRCHLLIGPPASGKTTLAQVLAPLVGGVVLSTDRIRAELFGDAAVQGPWVSIEAALHQRLAEHVAAGTPVIVDATHARRPWRLALTQALELPVPVEWIGWWLHTPLATCLEWNQNRERLVPEAVVREMAAALADPHFSPRRSEGLALVVSVVPTHHEQLEPLLRQELGRLEPRLRAARNRQGQMELHGYSRLLDIERLLYLIQLLITYPDLASSDPATRAELGAIVSPLPSGDLADRAAAILARLHGTCYGQAAALQADLQWLEQQGFTACRPVFSSLTPAPPPLTANRTVHGGYPPTGDWPVFERVMLLLRYILQEPFDHHSGTPLRDHLIGQLEPVPGSYLKGEADTLRKDLELLLTPYGFRRRNDNVRHGYALGTALLSAQRLREIHGVVSQAAGRLADPTAQDLLAELEERLRWAGVNLEEGTPVRAFANRSIIHPAFLRPDCLAVERQAEVVEAAIVEHRRLELERYPSAASFSRTNKPGGVLRIWPLQLLFHTIGWYLAFELDVVGTGIGLISCERLDRLALRHNDRSFRRDRHCHQRSLQRLQTLLHHSGGLYFGDSVDDQLALLDPTTRAGQYTTLRFCCQAWSFAFLREGLQRYPIAQIRYARPLPGDDWWHHPQAPHVLEPGAPGDRHPYPVELDLPHWTVAGDVDLRNWLFAFGDGIRIESPPALRQEHCRHGQRVARLYGETP